MNNGVTPCMICNKKNYSSSLEQMKRIREFLMMNRNQNMNHQITNKASMNTHIANTFIHSTHNHCDYGISCPHLSQMTNEANNIARMIENDITVFIQNADKAKLHELLTLVRGYFPQAYTVIERYWYECHK